MKTSLLKNCQNYILYYEHNRNNFIYLQTSSSWKAQLLLQQKEKSYTVLVTKLEVAFLRQVL